MLKQAKDAIVHAEYILVFAGAGMSVDSNLPTYRDKEGFWNNYPLYRELNRNYISMMSPHGFLSNPEFAWGFFGHQYSLYENALPHSGYSKLLALCKSKKDFFVVTTNVDGLFLKAGFPQVKLHEAHGSIHRLQCSNVCKRRVWSVKSLCIEIDYQTMRATGTLPLCKHCGGVARPNIFMYGDTDDTYIWEEVQQKTKFFRAWREKYKESKVLILEIGVGAKGMKSHVQQYFKVFSDVELIRINPEIDTSYDENVIHLKNNCKEAMDDLSLEKLL